MLPFSRLLPQAAAAAAAGIVLAVGFEAHAFPGPGHWEGVLRRGDATTPVRLHLTREPEPSATLDLPDLVYAEEPVEVRWLSGNVTVEFPFGVGAMDLRPANGRLIGQRGSISIELLPSAPPPFRRESTTISVNGTELTAEVYMQPGDTPAGAVIIAGGSSAAGSRIHWNTRSWCDFIARQGMHCLVYARRPDIGTDGVPTNFDHHVSDLLEIARRFASRPGVDPERLGVFARSRGVWIAAEAAAQDPAIRFLMFSGGPATTPSDQDTISVVTRLRADGLREAEIAEAVAYQRLYFYVAQTGRGWPLLEEALSHAMETRWKEYIDQPRSVEDLAWWGANGSHDPALAFGRLSVPVLATWGGRDAVTPPRVHAALMRSLMSSDAELVTLVAEGGDHRGEQAAGPDQEGTWRWFGMAPGLLDGIRVWLSQHGYGAGVPPLLPPPPGGGEGSVDPSR